MLLAFATIHNPGTLQRLLAEERHVQRMAKDLLNNKGDMLFSLDNF